MNFGFYSQPLKYNERLSGVSNDRFGPISTRPQSIIHTGYTSRNERYTVRDVYPACISCIV